MDPVSPATGVNYRGSIDFVVAKAPWIKDNIACNYCVIWLRRKAKSMPCQNIEDLKKLRQSNMGSSEKHGAVRRQANLAGNNDENCRLCGDEYADEATKPKGRRAVRGKDSQGRYYKHPAGVLAERYTNIPTAMCFCCNTFLHGIYRQRKNANGQGPVYDAMNKAKTVEEVGVLVRENRRRS